MTIEYLAHSCFLITSENGTRVVVDPYESGGFGGAVGFGPVDVEADVVVISHEHADHAAVSEVRGKPEIVRDSKQVRGVRFEAVPCFHDETRGSERGPMRIMSFVVDGVRVCHLGDLGHVLTEKQVKELKSPQVLMVPVGGHFTIGPAQAKQVVADLQPRVVIPMHFKMPQLSFVLAPVDDFLRVMDRVERAMKRKMQVTAETLPPETTVYHLVPSR